MPDRADSPAPAKGRLERATAAWSAFARMPLAEKLLLPLCWLLMALSSIAVALLPFRLIAPVLGRQAKESHVTEVLDPALARRARWVRHAVNRSARLMPLRSDCLPQAFAASLMCRLLGLPSTAHIGVRPQAGEDGTIAHAWVLVGDYWVSGGLSIPEYQPITCFRRS